MSAWKEELPRPNSLPHRLLDGLGQLVFPPHCIVCNAYVGRLPDFHLCDRCADELKVFDSRCCHRCGIPIAETLDNSNGCPNCHTRHYWFEAAAAAGPYEGTMRSLILALKFGRQQLSAVPLGLLLAHRFESLAWDWIDCIVPVPLHWLREYQRGFNQARLLAQELSVRIHKPVLQALRRRRKTPPQTTLGHTDRLQNVKEAFALSHVLTLHKSFGSDPLRDKHCLLIDDVMTTGATLSECARVLRRAGVASVVVLTAAR